MNWNEIIKGLREDNDLTQKELASYLGIDTKTLQRYEKGKTEPTLTILLKLSKRFNVTIDYICCNDIDCFLREKKLKKDLENITYSLTDILKKMQIN